MNKKMIIDAYVKIRTIDQSIPDDVLDFMKIAAIEKLERDTEVTIPNIKPLTVDFYNPKGELQGKINEYELNDILIQLKNNYVSGYYCLFNGEKVYILEGGVIHAQPIGFFDTIENQLHQLM